MFFGVTGYTGRLTVERAPAAGLRPILAARNERRLRPLAEAAGLEGRVLDLVDPPALDAALADIDVVLNLAGPYSQTARPLIEACLRTGTHYLDVTGEVPVLDDVRRYDGKARARGVMVMAGAGFAVAASDCLAARVAARLPDARRLRLGYSRSRFMSRGSARTAAELLSGAVPVCRDGRLTEVAAGSLTRLFDFGRGPSLCAVMGWGDVATASRSTAIPDVETYLEVWPWELAGMLWLGVVGSCWRPPAALVEGQLRWLPEGPSESERRRDEKHVVAEAETADGRVARSRMRTPNVYDATADTATLITRRVLDGDFEPGVRTPAQVYGPELLAELAGVTVWDLDG